MFEGICAGIDLGNGNIPFAFIYEFSVVVFKNSHTLLAAVYYWFHLVQVYRKWSD